MGLLGSNVFQKIHGFCLGLMSTSDPMHTFGGEAKRIFRMVAAARLNRKIASHEIAINK